MFGLRAGAKQCLWSLLSGIITLTNIDFSLSCEVFFHKNQLTFFSGKIRGILPYQPAFKYDEVLDPAKDQSGHGSCLNCDSQYHQVKLWFHGENFTTCFGSHWTKIIWFMWPKNLGYLHFLHLCFISQGDYRISQ